MGGISAKETAPIENVRGALISVDAVIAFILAEHVSRVMHLDPSPADILISAISTIVMHGIRRARHKDSSKPPLTRRKIIFCGRLITASSALRCSFCTVSLSHLQAQSCV